MSSPRPEAGRLSTSGFRLGTAGVLLLAAALLSIGLTRDWRLLHEDNGAFHTALALSHLRLGLSETRGHDFFVDARTGQRTAYGHHPPGVPLVLAAVFRLTGSDSPAVARSAAIVFHLASLTLLLRLLRRLDPGPLPFAVLAIVAVLPMSAYFGRMVNYEAFCLPFVLLQLDGYAAMRGGGLRGGLLRIATGIFLGGLFDWPAFFFGVVLTISLFRDALFPPRLPRWAFAVPAAAGLLGFSFDLAHLAWANGGSLAPLAAVLSGPGQGTFPPLDIVLGVVDTCRRYLGHAGPLCGLVAVAALFVPALEALFDGPDPALERRLLGVSGAGWLGYALAAPSWAKVHPYWQFYLLPFTALSLLVCLRALRRSASIPGRWAIASRVLVAALALETVATSAYVLRLRHTRVSDFAVEKTRELRSTYLAPAGAEALR